MSLCSDGIRYGWKGRWGKGLLHLVRRVRVRTRGEQRRYELGRFGAVQDGVAILVRHGWVRFALEQHDLKLGRSSRLQRRQAGLRSWGSAYGGFELFAGQRMACEEMELALSRRCLVGGQGRLRNHHPFCSSIAHV